MVLDAIMTAIGNIINLIPKPIKIIVFTLLFVTIAGFITEVALANKYICSVDGEVIDYESVRSYLMLIHSAGIAFSVYDPYNPIEDQGAWGILKWLSTIIPRTLVKYNVTQDINNTIVEVTDIEGNVYNTTFENAIHIHEQQVIDKWGVRVSPEGKITYPYCDTNLKLGIKVLHIPIFDLTMWIMLCILFYFAPYAWAYWQSVK